jgi:PAS domain S-box-containing protein
MSTWAEDKSIDGILAALMQLMNADYDVQLPVEDVHNPLHAINLAVNITAEVLEETTVSRHHLDSIVQAMADALLVVTPAGVIQTANRAATAMLGYPEQELVGEPIRAFVVEEDDFRDRPLQDLAGEGAVHDLEVGFRAKDGTEVRLSVNGSAMRGPDGELQGMVFIARDLRRLHQLLRARKAAEQSAHNQAEVLKRKAARNLEMILGLARRDFDRRVEVAHTASPMDQVGFGLNLLAEELQATTVDKAFVDRVFDSMVDVLVVVDSKGHIQAMNRATTNTLGFSRAQLIGKPAGTLFGSESLLEGAIRDLTLDVRTAAGGTVPMILSGDVMHDIDGHLAGVVVVGRDQRETQQLRQQANLFALLEHSQEAIEITDSNIRISYVNPSWERVTGYTAAEAVGRTPAELLRSADHEPSFFDGIVATISSGAVWRGTYVSRRKDGSTWNTDSTISPVLDAMGAVRHYVTLRRDVSDRVRAERRTAELMAANARAEAELAQARMLAQAHEQIAYQATLLDQVNDAVIAEDQAGVITYWNRGAERMYGYLSHEVLGKTTGFMQTDFRGRERADIYADMTSADGFDGRVSHLCRDRTRIVVASRATAIRSEEGQVVGYVSANRDVTRLERTQAELRDSEKRFRLALQASNIGVFSQDRDLRFTEAHKPDQGLPVDSILGKTDADLLPEGQADEVLALKRRVLESGVAERQEMVVSVGGGQLWSDLRVEASRDLAGEIIGVMGVSVDITAHKKEAQELATAYRELKHAQAQLVQAGKLAALGELAGAVAHEINNPLMGVLLCAQLLAEDLDASKRGAAPDLQRWAVWVDRVDRAAERCGRIVRSLLDFGRQSSGEKVRMDLRTAVELTVDLVGHRIEMQATTLTVHLPAPLQVIADTHQLGQVVLNLLLNAAQALGRGGEVRVVGEHARGEVRLSVADTGPGIPDSVRQRLFEPFFTTKPQGLGTGLGLSITYGILADHQGRIEVESAPGEGATFTVVLPAAG